MRRVRTICACHSVVFCREGKSIVLSLWCKQKMEPTSPSQLCEPLQDLLRGGEKCKCMVSLNPMILLKLNKLVLS